MAKKSSTAKPAVANKSTAIREILAEQPTANVKEVQAALAKRGIKASDALVNKIKYSKGRSGGKKRRGGKRKGGSLSKAEAIRSTFAHLGETSRARDVIAHLKKSGMKVSSAQVSTLRKRMFGNGHAAAASGSLSLDDLLAAKQLAERVGSIEAAQRALASLSRLVGG